MQYFCWWLTGGTLCCLLLDINKDLHRYDRTAGLRCLWSIRQILSPGNDSCSNLMYLHGNISQIFWPYDVRWKFAEAINCNQLVALYQPDEWSSEQQQQKPAYHSFENAEMALGLTSFSDPGSNTSARVQLRRGATMVLQFCALLTIWHHGILICCQIKGKRSILNPFLA